MIKQFVNDINWKYLLISCGLAILIVFPLALVVDYIKQGIFEYSLNHKIIDFPKIEEFQQTYTAYMGSIIWYPIHIGIAIIVQFISCSYLVHRSKNVEYTNAVANAVFLGILIYHFNILFILIGFVVSIFVAYKAKNKYD